MIQQNLSNRLTAYRHVVNYSIWILLILNERYNYPQPNDVYEIFSQQQKVINRRYKRGNILYFRLD